MSRSKIPTIKKSITLHSSYNTLNADVDIYQNNGELDYSLNKLLSFFNDTLSIDMIYHYKQKHDFREWVDNQIYISLDQNREEYLNELLGGNFNPDNFKVFEDEIQ